MSAEDWAVGLILGVALIGIASIWSSIRRRIRSRKRRHQIDEWNDLMAMVRASRPGKTRAVEINITSGTTYVDWCNECMRSHAYVRLWGYVDERPHEPVFQAVTPLCEETR